jgi:hypothetical protein
MVVGLPIVFVGDGGVMLPTAVSAHGHAKAGLRRGHPLSRDDDGKKRGN